MSQQRKQVLLFLVASVLVCMWCAMLDNVHGGKSSPSGNFVYRIHLEDDNAPCDKMKMDYVKAYAVYGDISNGTCVPSINGGYYQAFCTKERGVIKWGCNRSCSFCMSEDVVVFQKNGCGYSNGGCGILPFSVPMLWNIQYAQTPDNTKGDCSSYVVNVVGELTNQCVKSKGVLSDWEYSLIHCNATDFRRDVSDQRCGGPNKYFSQGKLNECRFNLEYTC